MLFFVKTPHGNSGIRAREECMTGEAVRRSTSHCATSPSPLDCCELSHILPLSFRREMMDIKLLFKSLFVSDVSNSVTSLMSYYEPD